MAHRKTAAALLSPWGELRGADDGTGPPVAVDDEVVSQWNRVRVVHRAQKPPRGRSRRPRHLKDAPLHGAIGGTCLISVRG